MPLSERLKTFSKFQMALELMTLAINIGTGIFLIVIWGNLLPSVTLYFLLLKQCGCPNRAPRFFLLIYLIPVEPNPPLSVPSSISAVSNSICG